jgi:hypothetical protein
VREKVVVRQANYEDLEKIRIFLSREWPLKREYYEYFHVIDGKLMFIVGEGQSSGNLYGVCGLIITNREKETNYQLVLLMVDKNENGFNSISLIKYIVDNLESKSISSCGVRPNALVIYEMLGFKTGKMDHFYKLADKESYHVAIVNEKRIIMSQPGDKKLKHIKTFGELEKLYNFVRNKESNPYKDAWCIKHRYFDSVYHKYKVYLIEDSYNLCRSIIVMREINKDDVKICKIVDFIGDDSDIALIGDELDRLIKENNYEYMDIYSVGIAKNIMKQAGFVQRTQEDKNVIPHLFAPFIQINRDIYYFTNNPQGFHMFRGDCDQDRPVTEYKKY